MSSTHITRHINAPRAKVYGVLIEADAIAKWKVAPPKSLACSYRHPGTESLQADGYTVTAPQFPLTTLTEDVVRLRQVLARQDRPTIVAGHSYGGQIMTALGTDAPNVVGLVYVAAFGLDEGESIGALLTQGPPSPALAHLDVDQQGFAWLPEDDFVNHFAADVDPIKAKVMYAVQQPLAGSALGEVMGVPAWKSLPSWYLVADGDQAIPADAERQFANAHGCNDSRSPDQPRRDGVAPRRRRKARQDRRRVGGGPRRGGRLIRARSAAWSRRR